MIKISVRQLNRNFKDIVRQLPVIITSNGKNAYILTNYKRNRATESPISPVKAKSKGKLPVRQKELSDTLSDKQPVRQQKVSDKPSNPMDFCPKHPGSRKITCGCK